MNCDLTVIQVTQTHEPLFTSKPSHLKVVSMDQKGPSKKHETSTCACNPFKNSLKGTHKWQWQCQDQANVGQFFQFKRRTPNHNVIRGHMLRWTFENTVKSWLPSHLQARIKIYAQVTKPFWLKGKPTFQLFKGSTGPSKGHMGFVKT